MPHVSRLPHALRPAATLACLLAVSLLALGLTAPPASATISYLCKGYAGCRSLGMPNAGYSANSRSMYWNMYSGHNCTNYVAYRMVRSGLPNTRPWVGPGNASYWGVHLAHLTDSTPRVGAVAWWKANVPGAGSAGHVAYVEQVLSADEIIVSQDSWGGTFSWARITRSGTGWPSGFIHLNDVRLASTVAPVVSGTPRVGTRLRASTGTWTPGGATMAYQWRADGRRIPDANQATLRLRRTHEGKQISVRVSATRLGYLSGAAVSASTAPVDAGELTSTESPRVSGEAMVGATLTATPGSWSTAPGTLAYQWTADGMPVAGATGSRLTVGPELVGRTLAVTVTARKNGYDDASTTSATTAPVRRGTLTRVAEPALTGDPVPGQVLRVDPGAVSPSDAHVRVRWLRGGVPVAGATGMTYRLTNGDLGSRIAARVGVSKPGYTRLSTRTPATRRVKATPTLVLDLEPGPGRVRVVATVVADGVRPVPGSVRVRSGGLLHADLPVRRGRAAVTLRDLPGGPRTLRVRYVGGDTVSSVTAVQRVRIG